MRAAWPAAAIAVCAGVALAGAGTGGLLLARHVGTTQRPAALASVPVPPGLTADVPAGPAVPAVPARSARPAARQAARPVSLVIPAISVSTSLIRLGLTSAGTLQVPSSASVAGWYTGSSRPGAIGTAVIVGQIDSYPGPGVFFRLIQLRPGDQIYVRRADSTTVLFSVTSVQTYSKDQFPERAVYGPTPDPELRLITCGGAFDPSRHAYLSNVVVFATLSAGA